MDKNVVISVKSALILAGIAVLGYLLLQISDILFQLLIALIFSLSVEPAIRYMNSKRMPRWLSVVVVFGAVVLVLAAFMTVALPPLIGQISYLITRLPGFVNSVITTPQLKGEFDAFLSQLTLFSGNVFTVTIGVFTNFFNILTVFVFALYLSFDLPNLKKRFLSFFDKTKGEYIEQTMRKIELNLGRWVVGQAILMITVGMAGYIGLLILKVPYAAPLAVLSGLLEVVPVLGPIIATIVGGVVGFSLSKTEGYLIVILFIGIQELENNLLVPRIMQKVVGFNPLVTMLALLIGAKFYGVIGAFISIPTALILSVIVRQIFSAELKN